MKITFTHSSEKENDKSRLGFPKTSHTGEIVFIIFGLAVMLFPVFVDMGAVPPIVGAEILGFCFVLMGAAVMIDSIVKTKKRERVYREGRAFTGVITRIDTKTRRKNTGAHRTIHYYAAECEMVDPDTNEKYLYSSHHVRTKLYEYVGRQVTIYVDMKDRSNYYVDLSSLL